MSVEIDKRVVEMAFDNASFEKNAKATIKTLDKLEKSLDLEGSSRALELFQKRTNSLSLSKISSSLDEITSKFSTLGIVGITALTRLTNKAIDTGKKMVEALTIEPVSTGLQEYETQIGAIQTILANTKSKGSSLNDVNKALDELNRYADLTIYNFTEMTRNIGTFTAAGIGLEDSVKAIKGIANLGAISGSRSQQVSTAMYQLSQALAAGTVKLMDWNSVVNAGMGGEIFQESLKETARVHGINVDAMIAKQGSFRESLQEGWITSEILIETLQKFTGDLSDEQLRAIGYTEEQIEGIKDLAKTATDAATKVKTFTQLFDVLKETAQSGWTGSWENIIGNFEEAQQTLTNISYVFQNLIETSSNARNELLSGWKDLGGRTALVEAFVATFNTLASVVVPVKRAFDDIFPPMTSRRLYDLTIRLRNFIKGLQLTNAQGEKLRRSLRGLFAVLDIGVTLFSSVLTPALRLFTYIVGGSSDSVLDFTGNIGDMLVAFRNWIKSNNIVLRGVNKLVDYLILGIKYMKLFYSAVKESQIVQTVFGKIITYLLEAGLAVQDFGLSAYGFITGLITGIRQIDATTKISSVSDFIKAMVLSIQNGTASIGVFATDIQNKIGDAVDFIIKKFASIRPEHIATAGFILGLIIILKTIKQIGDAAEGITSLTKSVAANFNKIGKAIAKLKQPAKSTGILKIAVALGILAASIKLLSDIKGADIAKALATVATLSAILVLIEGIPKNTNLADSASTLLVYAGFSIALVNFAKSLKILSDIPWQNLLISLGALIPILFILLEISTTSFNFSPDAVKRVIAMTLIGPALYIFARSLEKLGNVSFSDISKSLKAFIIVLGTLLLVSFATKKLNWQAMLSLIPMAVGLRLIVATLRKIGEFNVIELGTMLKGLLRVVLLLGGVMLASRLAGENGKSAAKILFSLGTSINLLVFAIKGISKMTPEEVTKGMLVVTGAYALFALIIGISKFAGEHAQKAGKLITSMSIAMFAMIGVIAIISTFKEESITKGLIVIAAIDIFFSILLAVAGGFGKDNAAVKGITRATVAIIALSGLIGLFSLLKTEKIVTGMTAIGVASIALSVLMAASTQLKKIKIGKKEIANLAVMEIAIGALGLILTGLANIGNYDPKRILSLSIATSILSLAMGSFLAITKSVQIEDATKLMKTVAVMVLTIGALGGLLTVGANNLQNAEALIPLATASSIALIALSGACWVVSKIPVKEAAEGALGLVAFLGILAVAFEIIGGMTAGIDAVFGVGSSIEAMSRSVEALGLLGEGLGKFITGLGKGIGEAVTAALPKMGTDLSNFMMNLQPFLEILREERNASLDGAEKLIEIVVLFTAAKFMTGINKLLRFNNSIKVKDLKKMFEGIGKAYAAFAKAVSTVPDHNVVEVAASTAECLTVLANKLPRKYGVLQFWLGSFTGWKRFASGLEDFGNAYAAYASAVSGITNFDTIEVSANAAGSLAALANALPETGGKLQKWFGEKLDLASFGSSLEDFGAGLKAYSEQVIGVKPEVVESTANAALALAVLANSLPETNTILENLFGGGNQTLAQFADQLLPFAIKFVNYSGEMAKSDSEVVNNTTAAVEALRVLSALATDVVGDINLSGFGASLLSFGEQFKKYADQVSSIDTNELDRIISSIRNLKGLITSIVDEGYISDDVSFDLQLHGMMASLIFILQESEEDFKITGAQLITAFIGAMLSRFQESTILITERSYQIGQYMVEGIRNGITGNMSMIDAAGALLASNLINNVNDILGIASPSKEGIKTGMYYAVGVGIGIDENQKIPVDSAEDMSQGILDKAKEVLTDTDIGEIFDADVANDIKENANKVIDSAKNVAGAAVDKAKEVVDKGLSSLPQQFADKFKNVTSIITSGKTDLKSEFTDWFSELGGGGIFDVVDDAAEAATNVQDSMSDISEYINDGVSSAGKSAKEIVDIDHEMLSEEEEYWRKLLKIKRQGADADKYNALSVKEFEKEVFEETLEIWEQYTNKLKSTADSVMSSHNLFDAVEKSEAKSKDELFKNLDDQIEEYRQYANTLATVTFRLGDDSALAEYLKGLGVSSLEQLKVINAMTDDELTRYAQLYDTKYAYATNIASQQISDFREETEQKLEELYGTMAGSVDLQQFADNFTGTFDSITSYLNNIALPMSESIKASMETLSQSAGESITANDNYITDALNQTFDEVKSVYNDRASEYGEETGEYLDQGIGKGISDSTAAKEAASQSIDEIKDAYREAAEISSPSQLMADEVGLYLTEGVGKGMTSRIAKLYLLKTVIEVVNYLASQLNSRRDQFVQAGQNAGQGFAEGMRMSIMAVMAAAGDMGNASVKSTAKAIDAHSPSRKFMELGRFAMLGFAYGMDQLANKPSESMKKATEETMIAAEYAIKSIHNIIENGADDQFTIRPVMDLSDVQTGMIRLTNMMSVGKGINVSSSIKQAEETRAAEAQKYTSGTGNNYTFNQYNTSPKALSSIDIYRRTRNQFSMLKEATSG